MYQITIVNESRARQSKGCVTQTFGLFFERGEVTAGAYPYLWTNESREWPVTLWGFVHWPDGSLRWCGAMVIVPIEIPAGASIEVEVRTGARAPKSSSLSLADAASLKLNVSLSGVANLVGDWVASLGDAMAVASNVVCIASGAAGAIYRVGGKLKRDGLEHNQLHCWHYVQVLQGPTGSHAGTRYLGRVGLPWCDVDSPAPVGMAVTLALRSNDTVIRQLQGMGQSRSLGTTVLLPHYGSIATCGTDAMWDFFPREQSAECVLRVKPAGKKAARVRLVPPFDFDLKLTASTVRDYVGHGNGSMVYRTGTTGERAEIGLFPAWAVKYIVGDPQNAEREVRVNAMVTTGWVTGARRRSTGAIVPTVKATAEYKGLGPNQPTWRWGYDRGGFSLPKSNAKLWEGEVDMHHRGGAVYTAYIFTAEPQYLDLLSEQAANLLSILPQGSGTVWTTADPMTTAYSGAFHSRDPVINGLVYPGAGLLFRGDLERYAAWGLRDVAQAAAICPDICPFGTEIKRYLRDVIEANTKGWVDYIGLMPESYRRNGMMGLKASWEKNSEPWCMGYLANTYAHVYGLLGTRFAFECAQHLANYWISISQDPGLDLAAGFAYTATAFDEDKNRVNEVARQFFQIQNVTANYSAADSFITLSAKDFGFSNGDVLRAPDATFVDGATEGTWLYVVNKVGFSFQVSLVAGGVPSFVLKTAAYFGPRMRIANFSPGLSFERVADSNSYMANIAGALRHMAAVGCLGLDAVIAEVDRRIRIAGVGAQFSANPKNALSTSIPDTP